MAIITGTAGDNVLNGTEFDDTITGRAGDDIINTGSGLDQAFGGLGDDYLTGFGDDLLYGGDGNDTLATDSFSSVTALIRGGDGDDEVTAFSSSAGGDLRGGDGIDLLTLYIGSTALHLDLGLDLVDAGPSAFAGLVFSGFERINVSAGGGDDSIIGADQADVARVAGGANFVDLAGGDDLVAFTTREANTLYGGDGQDTLMADAGSSSLYFIVDTFDGSIDDGSLSDISGFEVFRITGGDFDDIASLGLGNDRFAGLGGNDTGFGGLGSDDLFGGSQDDSLNGGSGRDALYGGTGDDILIGGGHSDTLGGGAGSDSIDAGAGDDRIRFYTGQDTVTGGSGADSFEFTRNQSGLHLITDYQVGVDQLQFTGIFLQNGPPPGPLDPDLLSSGAPVGSQAQFVQVYDALSDQTTLLWDPNGDNPAGGSYALVILSGEITLSAGDILIL